VEELAIGSGPHLVHHGWLKVDEHGPGDVLAGARLGEEGVEGVVAGPDGLVRGHLAVGLDAVLEAVELPAGIAYLDPGLADVDGDAFTLGRRDTLGPTVLHCPAHWLRAHTQVVLL
jgi:hypothetical protein